MTQELGENMTIQKQLRVCAGNGNDIFNEDDNSGHKHLPHHPLLVTLQANSILHYLLKDCYLWSVEWSENTEPCPREGLRRESRLTTNSKARLDPLFAFVESLYFLWLLSCPWYVFLRKQPKILQRKFVIHMRSKQTAKGAGKESFCMPKKKRWDGCPSSQSVKITKQFFLTSNFFLDYSIQALIWKMNSNSNSWHLLNT